MIFYHHTAVEHLDSIMSSGIIKGECPERDWANPSNAVWLTTDPNPAGHGLCDHKVLTEEERGSLGRLQGREIPAGAFFPDKRAVRFTMDLSPSDPSLFRWMRWARANVAPEIRDALIRSGGGMRKAKTWFIYRGVIAPDQFRDVHVRGQSLVEIAIKVERGERPRIRVPAISRPLAA